MVHDDESKTVMTSANLDNANTTTQVFILTPNLESHQSSRLHIGAWWRGLVTMHALSPSLTRGGSGPHPKQNDLSKIHIKVF